MPRLTQGKLLRLCCLLVVFFASGRTGKAKEWQRYDSPNFQLFSDASEKNARTILVELEQFRAVFLQFTTVNPVVSQRNTVVLFASESDFKNFKPVVQGRTSNVSGYFYGTAVQSYMALALGQGLSAAKRVIYHEYVHALYHEIEWRPPLWFNEGSAEVFATFRIQKGVAHLGAGHPLHVALLRRTGLLPLPLLFSIRQDSPAYNEGLLQGIFYAQSWALAHFLINSRDPIWRTRLNNFIAQMQSGAASTTDTFAAAMQTDLSELLKLLQKHVDGGGYSIFKLPYDDDALEKRITVRPATPTEVEVHLTILHAFARNDGSGPFRLIQLREKYPQLALTYEARAMMALKEGDTQRVEEELSRAIELGTSNVRTPWYLARDLVTRWLREGITPEKRLGTAQEERLRELLEQVLHVCPQAIEAWEALARVEAFSQRPNPLTLDRIEAAVKAVPDDPMGWQARMLVGFAWKRLGRTDAAREAALEVDTAPVSAESTRRFNRVLLGEFLPADSGAEK